MCVESLIQLNIGESVIDSLFKSIIKQIRGDLRLRVTLYTDKELYEFEDDEEPIYNGYILEGDYVVDHEVIDVDYIPELTLEHDEDGEFYYSLKFRPGDNPNMGFYDGYRIYWYDRDEIDVDVKGSYQFWSDRPPKLELMPI